MSLRSGRRRLTSRRRLATVALGAVGVLALSGCDLHPGAAAVVDGDTISQSHVDDVVTAVCHYIEIANKTAQTESQPAFADLRSSFTSLMIQADIVASTVDELGLTIYPADVDAQAQISLPDDLSSSDQDIINDYVQEQATSQVGISTIAAHLDDSGVTDSSDVAVDPNTPLPDYLVKRIDSADVSVNPSYGSWDGSMVSTSSGSLSVLVSRKAPESADGAPPQTDTANLPPSQICGS